MHFNVSLFKGKENAFFDPNTEMGLTETAYQFTAGVLKNTADLLLYVNPLVNSYKRLVPGYEAPCYIAWSGKNRSPLIRVPSGVYYWYLELVHHPAANPYMALAAILEAGLDGIKNKLKVPEPVNQNIYEMNREEREAVGIQDFPSTLYTALKAIVENEVIKKALGNHIYNQFINSKSIEWDCSRTQVSEWERDQYMKQY